MNMKNNSTNKYKLLLWNEIDWDSVESNVEVVQKRIYKASLSGNKSITKYYQNLLISSRYAKLLAVRRITTENKGKYTAGVDGRLYLTPEEKMALANNISIDGSASPIRRIWIPKPGKAELVAALPDPLGIPIIRDRVKQKLVLMALEPEWEAKFEPESYARPGRSTHDASQAIFNRLKNHSGIKSYYKYILDADLKGCFDNIDPDYLINKLETLPKISKQVSAWLKAGIFDGKDTTPNLIGTPQGGVISPFLANVALHGMEIFLKDWIKYERWKPKYNKKSSLGVINRISSIGIVRYADDFVVIHEDYNIIVQAKEALSKWLSNTSKLQLNNSKTKIIDSRESFNFLGLTFINIVRNDVTRVKIYPSKQNQKSFIKAIGDRCRKYRSLSAYDLIESLRPVIIGWAYYYRYYECKEVFHKMDHLIFQILRSWVFRRDRRNGRLVIKQKYFPSGKVYEFDGRSYQDNWILCGKSKGKNNQIKEIWLPRLSWVSSINYIKVQNTRSIYDGDDVYWSQRSYKYGSFNLRERNLLKKQKGKCTFCNKKFRDNNVEIDHIIPKSAGGKDNYTNWQLLHKHCHIRKTQKDFAAI